MQCQVIRRLIKCQVIGGMFVVVSSNNTSDAVSSDAMSNLFIK